MTGRHHGRFLFRTGPDGRREVSWRVWVLVWVAPAVFAAAVLYLALEVMVIRETHIVAEGEVTHVYAWPNDAPQIFYPGEEVYSPRFRYTWTDGTETEATTGSSHTGWNFEIGSRHTIRYDPAEKNDVVLAGPSEWWVARTVAVIGAWTLPFALLATLLVLRWRARGKPVK